MARGLDWNDYAPTSAKSSHLRGTQADGGPGGKDRSLVHGRPGAMPESSIQKSTPSHRETSPWHLGIGVWPNHTIAVTLQNKISPYSIEPNPSPLAKRRTDLALRPFALSQGSQQQPVTSASAKADSMWPYCGTVLSNGLGLLNRRAGDRQS